MASGRSGNAAWPVKRASRSLRGHYVITVMELLSAASACTYAKTPASAFPLVTGSLATLYRVPLAGFEPAHTAPEDVDFPAVSPGQRLTWHIVRLVVPRIARAEEMLYLPVSL